MEEGANGIRATSILPGEVATPILEKRPVPAAGARARAHAAGRGPRQDHSCSSPRCRRAPASTRSSSARPGTGSTSGPGEPEELSPPQSPVGRCGTRAPSQYRPASRRGGPRSSGRGADDHAVAPHAAFAFEPIAEIGDAEAVALDQCAQLGLIDRRCAREGARRNENSPAPAMRDSSMRNNDSTPSVSRTETSSGK